MKKILGPGLLAGLAMFVAGMILNFLLSMIPSITNEYLNSGLFRLWSDPLMWLFFIAPFILGIILAAIWAKTKKLFKGTVYKRGKHFGFWYFLVTIPGMIITYSSFEISLLMVLTWVITIFVQAMVAGMVLAKLNK